MGRRLLMPKLEGQTMKAAFLLALVCASSTEGFSRRLQHKTFKSTSVMVNDDYNAACALEAQLVLWGCASNGDDVVCDDTLSACIEDNLSDDCHDPVCDTLAESNSYLTCPSSDPPTTPTPPDDDVTCWSVNVVATDQWCMDNCFHPGASYCPSGFCDCNCDAGDPGCPRSAAATAKAKLSKVLKKSYNKVQRSFMVNDDHDDLCLDIAAYDLWGCLIKVDDTVDDDSLMLCMVSNLSDECQDLACGVLDDANSFLSCPGGLNPPPGSRP